jgi:hypothetical protein
VERVALAESVGGLRMTRARRRCGAPRFAGWPCWP